MDGDGRDEFGVTRTSDDDSRFWVFDDASEHFAELLSSGDGWGTGSFATAIAFGDVDGDGLDEVGVARKSDINQRYFVFDDSQHQFRQLMAGGETWGAGKLRHIDCLWGCGR